jgi:hypothetical protein
MKNLILLIAIAVFSLTACSENKTDSYGAEFGDEESLITLKSGYEVNVISPIIKPADFEYITKGVVEYSKDETLIARLDYGDGTKDARAILNINGIEKDIDLSAKKKKTKYKKVISSPLIKIEGCNYIVSGTIKYFEGENWVATIEYGDGTCDEWATKIWKNGSEKFSMQK